AEQGERVGDVRRAAAAPLVHRVDEEAEADPVHVFRQEMLGELPRKRHQVVVGDRSGDDDFHFAYFPMIGASSFLVCSGHSDGWVMIAVASAFRQPQVRASSMRSTAVAMVFCAVAAFCIRFAMIRSTVTES